MNPSPTSGGAPSVQSAPANDLEHWPHDELLRLCRSLGLSGETDPTSDELLAWVRRRRALIAELDRESLLEVIRWGRRRAPDNADNEELVRHITRIDQGAYDGLSRSGLVVLARLRDIEVHESDPAERIIENLHQREGFWRKFHRTRRRVVGGFLSRILEQDSTAPARSVPTEREGTTVEADPEKARPSLRKHIEDHGVVAGIAQRLRGAADDYIQIKLDEIDARIDLKLNEIDRRLAEWRDREIANRLKILRMTLAVTVLVAILSLGYNVAKRQFVAGTELPPAADPPPSSRVE